MIIQLNFSHDKNGYPISLVECDTCKTQEIHLKHNLKWTGEYKFSTCKQCERISLYKKMEQKHNFTLLSNVPCTTKEISEWMCPNGHILEISYMQLRNRKGCDQCRQNELQIKYKQILVELNYAIIGDFPQWTRDKITLSCPYGHIWITTLRSIGTGSKCHYCQGYWAVTPSNYSKEELDERRWSYQYEYWRKQVRQLFDFTCQICGKRGGKIHAHHLNGYNWDIKNRFNPENGVSLCVSCHILFHQLFGRKDNTKEQFLQFKEKQSLATETIISHPD